MEQTPKYTTKTALQKLEIENEKNTLQSSKVYIQVNIFGRH